MTDKTQTTLTPTPLPERESPYPSDLKVLLKSVPSLKNSWDMSFDDAWEIAFQTVQEDYPQVNFPTQWPHSREMEAMLNLRFWAELDT